MEPVGTPKSGQEKMEKQKKNKPCTKLKKKRTFVILIFPIHSFQQHLLFSLKEKKTRKWKKMQFHQLQVTSFSHKQLLFQQFEKSSKNKRTFALLILLLTCFCSPGQLWMIFHKINFFCCFFYQWEKFFPVEKVSLSKKFSLSQVFSIKAPKTQTKNIRAFFGQTVFSESKDLSSNQNPEA